MRKLGLVCLFAQTWYADMRGLATTVFVFTGDPILSLVSSAHTVLLLANS